MHPEVQRHVDTILEHYTAAALELRRAKDAADRLGGRRRPQPGGMIELVELAAAELRVTVERYPDEIYPVCGRTRPRGIPCTLPREHTGDCAADYSAAYRRGDGVGVW